MRKRKIRPVVDRWKLQEARRKAGYNRPRAAIALDVTESAVNAYEQGRTDPSARVLLQMAWLYRTKVEKLCRDRADIEAELADDDAGPDADAA